MSVGGSNGWSDGQMTVESLAVTAGFGAKWMVAARNSDGRRFRADIDAAWDADGAGVDVAVTGMEGTGLAFDVVHADGVIALVVTPDDAGWSWRTNLHVI